VSLHGIGSVESTTYVALAENVVRDGRPGDEYLARIVTGARQHGLPEAFIEKIKRLARVGGE
jgi:hypothetical protein